MLEDVFPCGQGVPQRMILHRLVRRNPRARRAAGRVYPCLSSVLIRRRSPGMTISRPLRRQSALLIMQVPEAIRRSPKRRRRLKRLSWMAAVQVRVPSL